MPTGTDSQKNPSFEIRLAGDFEFEQQWNKEVKSGGFQGSAHVEGALSR